MSSQLQVLISGRVQGVFFRTSTQRQALRLGIKGSVKNLPDGRVEVIVDGEPDSVQKLIAWCRTGPPGAKVDALEIRQIEDGKPYHQFSIR